MNPRTVRTMVAVIAGELENRRHVAVGANSPIPASAALLAHSRNPALRLSILGSEEDNPFTDGGKELFDCAAQGRIDTFFFSGVQIDACGNVNLLGIGRPPKLRKRFIGNFGAPYLSGLVPNIILFRIDHSIKSLVERVDFISAPGKNVQVLVTDRAVFRKWDGRFRLTSLHPGETLASVRDMTGFEFDADHAITLGLSVEDERVLGDIVRPRMEKLYPSFAKVLGG